MIRYFEEETHAALYKKYRERTPQFLVYKVMDYLEEKLQRPHDIAVDVGCGSGQNTLCFAPYFEKVYGFDVSPAQIEVAKAEPNISRNVSFGLAPAEKLPLEDNSVELVTGGSSFHWFDLPSFYKEVDRILVPNGVVAAIGMTRKGVVHSTKSADLNDLVDKFIQKTLKSKFYGPVSHVFDQYRKFILPYPNEVRLNGMPLEYETTVSRLFGNLTSWSAFQLLYKEDPKKIISEFEELQAKFMKIMEVSTSMEYTPIVVRNDVFVAMCRKP